MESKTIAEIVAWIRDVARSYRNTPISKGITIERFDILLMAIRSDNMDAHGMSVADSATATLVHGLANDSFVNFALLQFGGVS